MPRLNIHASLKIQWHEMSRSHFREERKKMAMLSALF